MGLDEMLEPVDSMPPDTRNSTPLSRHCEAIVETFLGYGPVLARVRDEESEYGLDELYGGLRRVCTRKCYMGHVECHKRQGTIVLERKRR